MRLYLSSYMLGDHHDRLFEMVGGTGARMAVVTNALDAIPLEAQLDYARTTFDPIAYFSDNGFDPSFVDLRRYFGRPDDLHKLLCRYRIIWALGGNTFLLRRAMRDSGFDVMLDGLLDRGIVYAGWSAGACVAGDRLEAVAIMDEPDAAAPGYVTTDRLDAGMGLVPFTIIPHYDSPHPEAELAGKSVAWAKERGIDHVALRDGDAVIRQGDQIEILSGA